MAKKARRRGAAARTGGTATKGRAKTRGAGTQKSLNGAG